jgi:hypothetical protein
VRGQFRVTCLLLASALMTNIRRIRRYLAGTRPAPPEQSPQHPSAAQSGAPNSLATRCVP